MAEAIIRIAGDTCSHCMGTGKEPSPIISIRERCSICKGNRSLIGGQPNYGMPLKDYLASKGSNNDR